MPPASHLNEAALLPWHGDAVVPALVPGACLSRALLGAFAQAMHDQSLPVQSQRMRYDRIYALTILGEAHGSGDAALRSLAVALFNLYQPWPQRALPLPPGTGAGA